MVMKKMSKIERTVEPWTNKEGDVIQPGDKVFAFTRCTGYLYIHVGTYLGVRKNTGYLGNRVQVAVQAEKRVAYLNGSKRATNGLSVPTARVIFRLLRQCSD